MKNPIITAFVFALCLFTVGSYVYSVGIGSSKSTKEKRAVTGFTRVTVKWPGNVVISQSDSTSLELRGQAKLLKEISTEVVNGELIIQAKDPNAYQLAKGSDPVRIDLSTPNLTEVNLNSNGKLKSDGQFSIETLTLNLNGSGKLFFSVKGDTLNAKVSGSGDMLVTGIIENENVTLDGSGKFEGAGLLTQNAKVVLKGSGQVWVNVMDNLDASVSGQGIIRYGGDPTVKKNVSGKGVIKPLS